MYSSILIVAVAFVSASGSSNICVSTGVIGDAQFALVLVRCAPTISALVVTY